MPQASCAALQAGKRLVNQPFREQIKVAMKAENEELSAQLRSEDAKVQCSDLARAILDEA